MTSRMLRTAVVGLGALAVPLGIAVAGAGSASANPDLCVSGPYGYAYACVDTPWPGYWNDGPRWRNNGWHHGHGDHDD
jgi:hypothetical protein